MRNRQHLDDPLHFAVDDREWEAAQHDFPAWSLAVGHRRGEACNSSIKIASLSKVTDITLRRGVVADASLYSWFNTQRSAPTHRVTLPLRCSMRPRTR